MIARKLIFTLVPLTLAHVALAGDPLDTWTWRNPLPAGSDLLHVACGNGKYVAFGYHDATALTSLDDGAARRPSGGLGRVMQIPKS
jgi:hypothetical protein